MTQAAELVSQSSVIFEKCWEERLCIRIPGDGRRCTDSVRACVRLISEAGSYYAELELLGERVRYRLASICYPVYSIGIAKLEVCTTDIKIEGSQIKSFKLVVKLCIGKWGVEKCWTLFDQAVVFSLLAEADDTLLLASGQKYIYIDVDE